MQEDKEVLSLPYAITMEDYVAFSLYHANHSPSNRKAKWRFMLLPSALWILSGLILASSFGWNATGMATLTIISLISLLWLPIAPMVWQMKAKNKIKALYREGQLKEREALTLYITPIGIRTETEDGESSLKWSGVKQILTTPSHIYLYVSNINALVVPRSAFTSEADCEQFLQTLRHYREQAAGLHLELQ